MCIHEPYDIPNTDIDIGPVTEEGRGKSTQPSKWRRVTQMVELVIWQLDCWKQNDTDTAHAASVFHSIIL